MCRCKHLRIVQGLVLCADNTFYPLRGQNGLAVKHVHLPGNIQEVGGSNPTAAMQVEKRKMDIGRAPCTECAQIVEDQSGRPAEQC